MLPEALRLPPVTRLSQRVWRIMGDNPGPMTLGGTNCYMVGAGRHRMLIDSGEGRPGFSTALQRAIEAATTRESPVAITDLVFTHWHHDHTGGIEQVRSMFPSCRVHKMPSSVLEQPGDWMPLQAESAFKLEGDVASTVSVIPTPGHTDDHVALFLDEENAIFSGDCVLGAGSSVFASFAAYVASMRKLIDVDATIVYPAHGPVVEQPATYLPAYLEHRLLRESQILRAVQELGREQPTLIGQIVAEVYGSSLDPKLVVAATGNVIHHLRKLRADGVVQAKAADAAMAEALNRELAPDAGYAGDISLSAARGGKCLCAQDVPSMSWNDIVMSSLWSPAT